MYLYLSFSEKNWNRHTIILLYAFLCLTSNNIAFGHFGNMYIGFATFGRI